MTRNTKSMRMMVAALLPIMVAACGGGSGGASNGNAPINAAAANTSVSSNAQRAVRDLGQGPRDAMLFRAIRDARQPCQNVRSSELSQTPGATPVYMTTCEDGSLYAVAIQDDGTAIVQPAMPAEGK